MLDRLGLAFDVGELVLIVVFMVYAFSLLKTFKGGIFARPFRTIVASSTVLFVAELVDLTIAVYDIESLDLLRHALIAVFIAGLVISFWQASKKWQRLDG